MAGVFAGLKVIDCASFIAAPAAATVMADFGADVIKIEPPGEGDMYRSMLTTLPGMPKTDINFPWEMISRTKRSLCLDLKSPDGKAVLDRLVADADVFITNLPLPARRRLGIAWEDLRPLNPRLVYGSFTAYGEQGPEADKSGFDSTAYWARSGLMDLVRADATSPPARSVPGMGDHPSAMAFFGAIVTALYRRERTGLGGLASSSLLANGLWANGFFAQAGLYGLEPLPRPKREDEQMRAAGALVPFAGEAQLTVSSPFALDGEEKVPPRRAPSLGQHSGDVLRDAGYSDADIARLRGLGVVA